jgi:hypothetical protein
MVAIKALLDNNNQIINLWGETILMENAQAVSMKIVMDLMIKITNILKKTFLTEKNEELSGKLQVT